ncbi:MAG: adenosylmethionine decarboxylase [Alphaproteobacteria bacterium]|nr:MAG: adenosylmethionine decarboxylase [Alphaproteobacteria bacterium]
MRPTLAQIGVKAVEARRPQSTEGNRTIGEAVANDHFVERNGLRFAGTHLILDLWEAERLDDPDYMRTVLERAVDAAGATLLHIHLHRFGDGGGVSGVAVLAESHISVHTWPERAFAAFDVFMCGRADPYAVIPILKEAFRPGRLTVTEHMRGILG